MTPTLRAKSRPILGGYQQASNIKTMQKVEISKAGGHKQLDGAFMVLGNRL